jgi:hypothetical protein
MDFAPVAQLDRVADFESEGCRFESCRARYINQWLPNTYVDSLFCMSLDMPDLRQFCVSEFV